MKVFLHIGPHKAGTTAVQTFLHLNSGQLAQHGIAYPEPLPGDHNHHALAVGLRDESAFQATAQTIKQQLAKAESARMHTCVYSSEMFSEHAIPIHALPGIFEGHELRVLAYVRRPDHQWASAYAQLLKEPGARRWQPIGEEPLPYDCGYSSIYLRWMEIFKPGELVLAPFDSPQWAHGNLLLDFLSMIGADHGPGHPYRLDEIDENAALPATFLEVLRKANEVGNLSEQDYEELVRALQRLADSFRGALGPPGRLEDPALVARAFAMLAPYLPVYRPYFRPGFDDAYLRLPQAN